MTLTEPDQAERCKSLLIRSRQGVLSTHSLETHGFPFGSLVQVATTEAAEPLLLTSRLAEHTKNFLADPRVSLCVAESFGSRADAMASARLTLVGRIELLEKSNHGERFLSQHLEAAVYLGFKDFLMARVVPESLRYVGGFGTMSWVSGDDYAAAFRDPVAEFAEGVIEHMNEDHQEAMICMAEQRMAQRPERARLVAVDGLGFNLQADHHNLRFAFAERVTTPERMRAEMVRLTRAARP
jgi:putative heme iron utilization protein